MPIPREEFIEFDLDSEFSVERSKKVEWNPLAYQFLIQNPDEAFTVAEITEAIYGDLIVIEKTLKRLANTKLVEHRSGYWSIEDPKHTAVAAFTHQFESPLKKPELYIPFFSTILTLPPEVRELSIELIETGRKHDKITNKLPINVAGAAVYIANLTTNGVKDQTSNSALTQVNIARIAGSSEPTIQEHVKLLKEACKDEGLVIEPMPHHSKWEDGW